ncbi:membrane protein [Stenotrophomonas daejeonensis]|uniref:Membrane protein n=1 Tax=Stenotrophomonas daejeonensis TaxID=659018 RepID=A0A0R0DXS2_9GAMM|nr:YeiH family protein [Stenotrophomonas daejeonensis]KRG86908.1 membrane protein [Stenotrophomonas daejeonensis]
MNTVTQGLDRPASPRLPGLLLAAAIAGLSAWLGNLPPLQAHGIGTLTLAIALGIAAGNAFPDALSSRASAGVDFAKGTLLRAGIVLYGLRLTLQDVAQVGLRGVLVDALVLCSTFALACWLGCRVLKLERGTALLIGAGSSICGAAAVMATAPVVKGRAEQAAVAVATVVVFGTLAMFAYPLLYRWGVGAGWMPLDEAGFGVFTGATVHEVAQVVAAGRAIGPQAADAAVIAKLVRVMMLAPFLLGLSLLLARGRKTVDGPRPAITVPWFAFGFIGMVAFNSLRLLPAPLVEALVGLDTALLAMAMAALGLTTRASALRRAGPRPMLLAALLFAWLLGGGMLINLAIHALP